MLDDEPTDPRIRCDDHTIVLGAIPTPEDVNRSRASLIVIDGWELGREFNLSENEHVFGRSLLATNRISAPSVSRAHAKIERICEEGQLYYEVSDLNSSNGTLVNNAPVTRARLKDGDRIQMGDVLFKFVLQDEVEARFHHDVHRLIHYDQLTGLMVMDAFRRRLDSEIRRGEPFALAMTDLDGLKQVNDTHGHLAGRMVVREMGAMIREAIRVQDIGGLYGGDEAIILFPETPLHDALVIAERLRQNIENRTFEFDAVHFSVTISQGLAEAPNHGNSVEQIIAAADRALYAAKASGRNCVRCAGS